jgi:predicted lipoprotein with Yx(FWY)xxD motif
VPGRNLRAMKRRSHLLGPSLAMVFLFSVSGLALANRVHPSVTKALVGVSTKASVGKFLVNAQKVTSLNNKTFRKGFMLYHLLKENTSATTHSFSCTGACLSFWPPLLLPKGMKVPKGSKGVTDKLGVINRPGVGKQITYDGWPLYFFKNDSKPGDTNGDGIPAFGSVWHAAPSTPLVTFTVDVAPSSTWGSVTYKYTYRHKSFQGTCSNDSCTYKLHAGVTIHLSEIAHSPSTWPFSQWTVKSMNSGGSTNPTSSAVVVKSNDDYDVTATYVLSGYPAR